jgi:hypothetical protein
MTDRFLVPKHSRGPFTGYFVATCGFLLLSLLPPNERFGVVSTRRYVPDVREPGGNPPDGFRA